MCGKSQCVKSSDGRRGKTENEPDQSEKKILTKTLPMEFYLLLEIGKNKQLLFPQPQ